MTAMTFQVTFDVADPNRLAEFWSQALGYQLQPPPDGFPSWEEFLKANNIQVDANAASAIVDPEGLRPRVYFQRVPEPKSAKNRLHLDLNVVGRRDASDDERKSILEQEADRLVTLGATRSEVLQEHGEFWVVMADPEGNEFCIQ